MENATKVNTKNNNIDIFLASYPMPFNFRNNSIRVLDTNESFKIFQKMCETYLKFNGFLLPYDDLFLKNYGAFKPSTGMLVIIDSILKYNKVNIVNFDNFRSNHYWKEDSSHNKKKYQFANQVIGTHQPILESSILITLEKMKLISRF